MEYLKVMLVDDEDLVIEDIQALIDWEAHGFRVVGFAYNGRQAQRLVEEVQPDIIFMDVSLPDLDGISLSRKLQERLPEVVIIILSGYMDFKYAQGAVEIGALSYIVKHQVTPESLLSTLSDARETIEKKKFSRLIESRFFLRGVLEQGISFHDGMEEALSVYRDPFLLLRLTPVTPWYGLQAEEKESLILQPHMSPLLQIQTEDFRILDILIYHGDILVFLGPCPSARPGKRYLGSLGGIVRALREELERQTQQMFVAVYLDHETVLSNLYADQLLLENAREIYRFREGETLLCIRSGGAPGSDDPGAGDPDPRFGGQMRKSCERQPDLHFIDREYFLEHYEEFQEKLAGCMERLADEEDVAGFLNCCRKTLELLSGFPEWDQEENTLGCYAGQIAAEVLRRSGACHAACRQRQQYAPSTNYMLQYIRDNYSGSPSLAEAAEQLQSNPMYLGQKFKKDTGKTFHNALNEYRIDRARELLDTTNLRIFEISEKVGISNSQYFSKIFKEITGLTPNEYKTASYAVSRRNL